MNTDAATAPGKLGAGVIVPDRHSDRPGDEGAGSADRCDHRHDEESESAVLEGKPQDERGVDPHQFLPP